jgi:hypothetical protein
MALLNQCRDDSLETRLRRYYRAVHNSLSRLRETSHEPRIRPSSSTKLLTPHPGLKEGFEPTLPRSDSPYIRPSILLCFSLMTPYDTCDQQRLHRAQLSRLIGNSVTWLNSQSKLSRYQYSKGYPWPADTYTTSVRRSEPYSQRSCDSKFTDEHLLAVSNSRIAYYCATYPRKEQVAHLLLDFTGHYYHEEHF